ncbi:hypothetical protein [Kineococcus rhizosphaerae]|uniref:Uncharacterized protein n=1 Tax=Kineococcus rhizosphaerae TaxID=559628 RepID=A0A2T0QY37_9ACTN|nr:hypothetical protein [Kineococcus rhizosphaerae]PRY11106.1 hypothetical protein CLV37_11460 [Kineococcus rhizosphaerae]
MDKRRVGRGGLRAELDPDLREPRLVLRDDDGIVTVLHVRHDRLEEVRRALDQEGPERSCVLELVDDTGSVQTWGRFVSPRDASAVGLVLLVCDRHSDHAVVREVLARPAGAQDLGRGAERFGAELARITTPHAPAWWEPQPL